MLCLQLLCIWTDTLSQLRGILVTPLTHHYWLQDKATGSAGLKIQALQFLHLAMIAGKAPAWQSHLAKLASPLFAAVGERYYKVAAEALRVCTHAVPVLRPSPPAPVSPPLQVSCLASARVLATYPCACSTSRSHEYATGRQQCQVNVCAVVCMFPRLGG